MKKLLLSLGVALLTLFFVEGVFRLVDDRLGVSGARILALRKFAREGSPLYEPYPYTNFVVKNQPEPVARPRDWKFTLLPHDQAPRIACLGGSTTYGSYPRSLGKRLETLLGTEVEVMNWGVPGWTTVETMVNYFINVQDYEPDIVILLHAINDTCARLAPGYRTDYAHWRTVWSPPQLNGLESLLLLYSDLYAQALLKSRNFVDLNLFTTRLEGGTAQDPLTDGSQVGFERNLRTIVEHAHLRGGRVILATQPYSKALNGKLVSQLIEQHNQILRDLADREGALLVDLERAFEPYREAEPAMFLDHVHLTEPWQRREALFIARAIDEAGWLASWNTEGGTPGSRETRSED